LLISNLAGLTYADTERLARNAIQVDGAITRSDLPGVMQAKYELLNNGGALQYEYDTARFSDVGGLTRLKSWLSQRRSAFRGEKDAAHLDSPKGILLTGVQGCGKSLAAKATAGIFGAPLLRLDFGTLYDKYHGETERKLRESLKTADVMAPCVLWIDEIEKAFSSAISAGDSGTSARVFGTFLTWMQEKEKPVFVIATGNDIANLPPELMRKGRFDEIFFVDLPDPEVRARIFSIHLNKRGQEPDRFDLERLAELSEGFSGAEIEQAVMSARITAHAKGAHVGQNDMLASFGKIIPLSRTMEDQLKAIRSWARTRALPATSAGPEL